MDIPILFYFVIIPAVSSILALVVAKRLRAPIAAAGAAANVILTLALFTSARTSSVSWAGMACSFRLDAIAGMMLLAAAIVALAVVLYAGRYLKDSPYAYTFYPFLMIALSFINGALISDNLTMMLFFWEGLLIPLFGLIATAHKDAYKTAVKTFVIIGVTDLCLMFGIALLEHSAHSLTISQMHVSLCGAGGVAFVFMMIGAVAKAGAIPFHSWIPDAAAETPLAFTVFLPASLARLLGIYLLIRMTTEIFRFSCLSWASTLLILMGIITILWGLLLAPAQKNPKKLLAYFSIALCGLYLLSIGSALPAKPEHAAFILAAGTIFMAFLFLAAGMKKEELHAVTASLSARVRDIRPLRSLYIVADQSRFDPYELAMLLSGMVGKAAFALDRVTNWVYDGVIPFCAVMLSTIVRIFHTGNYSAYIIWSLAGTITVIAFMVR